MFLEHGGVWERGLDLDLGVFPWKEENNGRPALAHFLENVAYSDDVFKEEIIINNELLPVVEFIKLWVNKWSKELETEEPVFVVEQFNHLLIAISISFF